MGPLRGEIWWVNFDPVVGHEQAKKRPALIVSADTFNRGPQRLVVVAPLTSTVRALPLHIAFDLTDCSPGSNLAHRGAIRCDQVRTVSLDRFLDDAPIGRVLPHVMSQVSAALRLLLNLPEHPI